MGDKNSLSLLNIEKPAAFQEPEKGAFEISENSAEKKEKKENFSQKSEKIISAEQPKNNLDNNLVSASNQQRFQRAKQEEIEKVLQAGLEDIYLSLGPKKQQEFKLEGEKITREINGLLAQAKINVGKIISLIRRWLALIPGVNRFFLEQEAKIKADEIIRLRNN